LFLTLIKQLNTDYPDTHIGIPSDRDREVRSHDGCYWFPSLSAWCKISDIHIC